MELGAAVSRARLWISAESRKFQISSVRETERRLDLTFPGGGFFITVPQGKEEWVCPHYTHTHTRNDITPFPPQGVWSEDDKCITILSRDMEQLCKPSNTLEEILERVQTLLVGGVSNEDGGVASEEEEDEDDDEEELADYYGGDSDFNQDETIDKERCVIML